ncbi:hypothetical protein [Rhizobium cremeum]|uniref:hypothetical protein n=1 Tax=Rhizobium cremeum TaxID=2813827 RepID=UPI0013AF2258|nr:hypothetical protein [Rhizobium cremeum]MCJ7997848.1 hypothetical protein [Rhizobium cremeum]
MRVTIDMPQPQNAAGPKPFSAKGWSAAVFRDAVGFPMNDRTDFNNPKKADLLRLIRATVSEGLSRISIQSVARLSVHPGRHPVMRVFARRLLAGCQVCPSGISTSTNHGLRA